MRSAIVGMICAISLAACISGKSASEPDDPLRPPGPVPGAVGIDPLIVGDRLLDEGEPEAALESYLRAAAGPTGPSIRSRQAIAAANISLGRLGQAEQLLRGIIEETPRNAAARNDLGVVLSETGRTGEAYQMFRTAFALQPSPEIRENLRLADVRLHRPPYDDREGNAFRLTRRGNGIYDLSPSGPQP